MTGISVLVRTAKAFEQASLAFPCCVFFDFDKNPPNSLSETVLAAFQSSSQSHCQFSTNASQLINKNCLKLSTERAVFQVWLVHKPACQIWKELVKLNKIVHFKEHPREYYREHSREHSKEHPRENSWEHSRERSWEHSWEKHSRENSREHLRALRLPQS